MKTVKPQAQNTSYFAMGKTIQEQIEYVEKYGNIGTPQSFRERVLEAFDVPKAKDTAENLFLFGCYPPFSSGLVLRDSINLLENLNIDYTYLENEYCCGAPLILNCREAERETWEEASRMFAGKNCDMARYKMAKNISYFCVGCVHFNKSRFPDEADRHLYLLDLFVDKLENRPLKLAAPKVIGYFPGCHTTYRKIMPGINLAWEKYRQVLNRVENLTIVDLAVSCCRNEPDRIVQEAQKQNLDTIVFPCNACYLRVRPEAKGKVRIKHYVEIALQSLMEE